MQQPDFHIEESYEAAIAGAQRPDRALFDALDRLPAAVYVTDADGTIVYANPHCAGFAGRQPEPGRDRWCVSWKLYNDDGIPMAHDKCPMAEAIRRKSTVPGMTAIIERPDGTRARFLPYPVPLFDESGALTGAVNMLLDISDGRHAASMREEAERCRRLAQAVSDRMVSEALAALADEYEVKASRIERPI